MYVNVNKSGRKDAVCEIYDATILGNFVRRTRTNLTNDAVLHKQQGLLDTFQRRKQRCSRKCNHDSKVQNGKHIL